MIVSLSIFSMVSPLAYDEGCCVLTLRPVTPFEKMPWGYTVSGPRRADFTKC